MKNIKIKVAAVLMSMSCSTLAFSGIITSSVDSSLSGASVIDFNSETLGSFSNRIFNGDVTISPTSGTFNIETAHSGQYGSSGAYLGSPSGQSFVIDFATTVSAFGFSWGAADQSWVMSLFDTSNSLLETISIAAQTTPHIGFIGADNIGISKVTMTVGSGFDYIILDDFQYVTENMSVPEPLSIALFGLGLAGIGFSRQKKIS